MPRGARARCSTSSTSGVTFHRNEEGKLGTRAFGGASAARTYYVADITGQAILHVLYEQLMKHPTRSTATRSGSPPALAHGRRRATACGAVARNIRDGSMELFAAKSVILATGGNGQCLQADHQRADLHRRRDRAWPTASARR